MPADVENTNGALDIGRLYFAYGSNMDDDQMSHRCPEARSVGTASLSGYVFALDSAGFATVVEKDASRVHGVLWFVSPSDEDRLDGYEGVASGCYRKIVLEVVDARGEQVDALVYISNRGIHAGKAGNDGYMDNIVRNARRLGFDEAYIEYLDGR